MDLQRRYGATVLTGVVRGGVLVEPPLIEKGGVAKNDLCTSDSRLLFFASKKTGIEEGYIW